MRRLCLFAALLALTACGPSKKEYDTALTESKTMAAEKDSLLTEVLENTKLVNDLNTELAKATSVGVSPVVAGESPASQKAEERQILLGKVREVVARLSETEANLAKSKARVQAVSAKDTKLIAQIEEYQKAISDLKTSMEQQEETFQAIIEDQRGEIAALGTQLDTVRSTVNTLGMEKVALKDTVTTLTRYKNTVYYVSGTKDELLQKGVIVSEGHKFLFFGSKTIAPARNLSPEAFTALDKIQDSVIALPKTDREYQIISRQSLDFLSAGLAKDGKLTGALHIASPEQFWSPSKYLILVED